MKISPSPFCPTIMPTLSLTKPRTRPAWSIPRKPGRWPTRSSARGELHHHHQHPPPLGSCRRQQGAVQEYPNLRVYGHQRDETRTPCISHMVDEGDTVSIGNLEGRFLFIPCHTSGHVAVHFAAEKVAFTGDTLFVAGCGRCSRHGRRHAQQHAQAECPARGHPHLPRP